MKKLLLILISVATAYVSYGQGCSDAGFCTMGAMSPSQVYTRKINFKLKALEISQYRGRTTLSPVVNASTLGFSFGITEKTSFELKLPYMWINGSLGSTSGIGDISYSLTRNVYSSEKYNINATLGGKIPTNNSDIEKGSNTEFTTDGQNQDLPMYYQTSLGTWDLVAGASLISKTWMFAVGLQVPVIHNNENQFSWGEWPEYPNQLYINEYAIARHLKRGADAMIRIERAFHFSNLDVRMGLLPIYRFTKDQIMVAGQYRKLDNTTGLALSGILGVSYHFNVFHSVKFLGGVKITNRDLNPDGLTRENVLSLAYVVKF